VCTDLLSRPTFPDNDELGGPALSVALEASVRFPWAGGRHPCLDVLVESATAFMGIESKRYEPFRRKSRTSLSDAYWRPVWGHEMAGFGRVRDLLRDDSQCFQYLDAAQLVKHAFGLRTFVHYRRQEGTKKPILLYLFAEPGSWPNGRIVPMTYFERHRAEIQRFAALVQDDEVRFHSLSYSELIRRWSRYQALPVQRHAQALRARFHL